MKIYVNDTNDIEVAEVYNPIVISTPSGRFGVAQRDGGIEVWKEGRLVWSSEHPEDLKEPAC